MTIAWMRVQARVMVRVPPRDGYFVASALHDCRLRWVDHEVLLDRTLTFKITRDGVDPEVWFYTKGLRLPGIVHVCGGPVDAAVINTVTVTS